MTNNITPQQANEWLNKGDAILIDVREADEFQQEHIPYALSLPLSGLKQFLINLKLPTNKKIIMQCFKGSRGSTACTMMSEQSNINNDVYNLNGGITSWKEAHLPVIGKVKTGISIFRQVQIIAGGLIVLMILWGLNSTTNTGFYIAGIIGSALCVAGITGWCGLAILLSKMPWNK